MKLEIQSAANFLSKMLKGRVEIETVDTFREALLEIMSTRYEEHWHLQQPNRGSAYRCVRINHDMDSMVEKAGMKCGLTSSMLFDILPNELTLWVDPFEVSYRIGEDGSIGILFGKDESDSSDSSDSSRSISPPPSPAPFQSSPPQMMLPLLFKSHFSTVDSFLSAQNSHAINYEYDQYLTVTS